MKGERRGEEEGRGEQFLCVPTQHITHHSSCLPEVIVGRLQTALRGQQVGIATANNDKKEH